MKITTKTDADSLDALTAVEKHRARWFRLHPNISEEQRSLTNQYFDEAASKVLTQSLADVVTEELLND